MEVQMTQTAEDVEAESLDFHEGLTRLRKLVTDIQHKQYEAGRILWLMDLTADQYKEVSDVLDVEVSTLRSWRHVYSRLKDSHARVSFSLQQQLARIEDQDAREQLFGQRPDWTVATLKEAVDNWLAENNSSPFAPRAKAGCRAKLNGRDVKVNLEVHEHSIMVTVEAASGEQLDMRKVIQVTDEVQQISFTW